MHRPGPAPSALVAEGFGASDCGDAASCEAVGMGKVWSFPPPDQTCPLASGSCSTLFLSGIPEACGAGTEDTLIAGKIQMYGSEAE